MSRRGGSSGGMTIGPLQAILLVGGVLVTVAWAQLFVLSSRTDDYFAWTIAPPLSAAFLGACYGGAAVVAFQSGRQREWSSARIGVPGVTAFVWLTLGATLLHLDRFHLDEGGSLARFAGWIWLGVYLLIPPALTIAYVIQRRHPGAQPSTAVDRGLTARRQPAALRAALVGLAVVSLAMGLALFLIPKTTADLWPWMLTPLVARAASAWLIAIALVLWALSRESNLEGLRAGFSGIAAIGVLQLVTLLRFTDAVEWSAVRSWLYVVILVLLTAVGVYGWLASRIVDEREDSPSSVGESSPL